MLLSQKKCVADVASGAHWHELIESIFGSVDMDLGDRAQFHGRIRRSVIGEIELNEVLTSYEDAKRTRKNIASDMKEHFVLVIPRAGTLYLSQDGRECTVNPGALAFFYLNSPHRYFHDDETRILDLKIPAPMLRSRVRHPDRLCAMTVPADHGVAKVTLDFIAAMADQLLDMPAEKALVHVSQLVDTVARLIDCEHADVDFGRASFRQAVRARCVALIDTYIGDPDLGPALLAARCGMSNRYIHAIFQDGDATVGEYIRNRRLSICYERLCRDTQSKLQVKDIALSTGFRSVAHFSNVFKARYGISPSEVRHKIS